MRSELDAAGFPGRGRTITLSAIFWITLLAHVITYLVLLIFFWISLASSSVAAVWWLTPFYWVHVLASGIFLVATVNTSTTGFLLGNPSILASIAMVIALILNIVAGYFYIIDLWLPCIFNDFGPNLSGAQKDICNNERLEVWITFIGAIVLIVLPVAGFIAALWDSLRIIQKTRAFSSVSTSFQRLSKGATGIVGKGRKAFRKQMGRSDATMDLDEFDDVGEDSLESPYYRKQTMSRGQKTTLPRRNGRRPQRNN